MTQINQIQKSKLLVQKKLSDNSGLVKKPDYNAKITEIEGKILSISGLATNAALTAVENKITGISRLVKKQIMTQKYQTLKINILLQLIPIILLKILLLIT